MNTVISTIELFGVACKFAAEKHRTQVRKNERNTPYFSHPSHCALLVQHILAKSQFAWYGEFIEDETGEFDKNVIVACLLHDTVEDTDTTYQELVDTFGRKIADIVMECTDDKSLPKVERKKLQIEHAKTASLEAKLVKMADKYSNLSDLLTNPPTTWSKDVIVGYWNWSFAVVSRMRGTNAIFDSLFDDLFEKANAIDPTSQIGSSLQNKLTAYYNIIAE